MVSNNNKKYSVSFIDIAAKLADLVKILINDSKNSVVFDKQFDTFNEKNESLDDSLIKQHSDDVEDIKFNLNDTNSITNIACINYTGKNDSVDFFRDSLCMDTLDYEQNKVKKLIKGLNKDQKFSQSLDRGLNILDKHYKEHKVFNRKNNKD